MRANSCLSCLLLLAAAPLWPIAVSPAQSGAAAPGNDMAPSRDDDAEEDGEDTGRARRAIRPERGPIATISWGSRVGPTALTPMRTRPAGPNCLIAHPDHDVVVCEAGRDGPAGAIVYLQKRKARQVE